MSLPSEPKLYFSLVVIAVEPCGKQSSTLQRFRKYSSSVRRATAGFVAEKHRKTSAFSAVCDPLTIERFFIRSFSGVLSTALPELLREHVDRARELLIVLHQLIDLFDRVHDRRVVLVVEQLSDLGVREIGQVLAHVHRDLARI